MPVKEGEVELEVLCMADLASVATAGARLLRTALLSLAGLLGLSLTACQGTTSILGPAGRAAAANAVRNDSNCGMTRGEVTYKGGKAYIPAVPNSGNFSRKFAYAPLTPKAGYTSYFTSCVYDCSDIPVPSGYLYDWFGEWRTGSNPGGFTFENATLFGEIEANVWVKHRQYYLFLYTTDGQLIQSSPIGPLAVKKQTLKFDSPFENGLVSAGTFEMEIVHPASKWH